MVYKMRLLKDELECTKVYLYLSYKNHDETHNERERN